MSEEQANPTENQKTPPPPVLTNMERGRKVNDLDALTKKEATPNSWTE